MPDVVVLAGGKGRRLAPYTTVLPKPLMPVGDMPVLEVLLRRLSAAGLTHVHLAVGHLAQLIRAYFGDGSALGLELTYWVEDEPLGTSGPLSRIELQSESVLVMNGDLLTSLDFGALLDDHAQRGAAATIAVLRRDVPIDFGVVQVEDAEVRGFEEKPVLSYDVSMGVYVFERAAIELVPVGRHFDFPELLQALLDRGDRVAAYRFDGFWLDIGRHEDYELALQRFDELRGELLGEV
jgi:NDP-sugar pyrophosphorylase family protein